MFNYDVVILLLFSELRKFQLMCPMVDFKNIKKV